MYRLTIAEKPELALAIANALGGGAKKDGYYECGSERVTWAFGHMLALCEPEDYDPKYQKWSWADLPIHHYPWKKKPTGRDDVKRQLKCILQLLRGASSVVHAGDPDEEGQLLVDEILEYAGCRLPVKRVLINGNTLKLVKAAWANMRDNTEPQFVGMSAAAEARSVGDQLYGFNMTRGYTLEARKLGFQGLISVGRVQTAILGMIVRRTHTFKAHTKAHYYVVGGRFELGGATFPARYQVCDADSVDDKARMVDADQAAAIADAINGEPAQLVSGATVPKETHAPLPYNLLKLQTDASRKFGYKPDEVLKITQTLRDRYKLITYNRSDCEYLSNEHHEEAPAVLAAIAGTARVLAVATERADPAIKSRAFNSSKVSAHHAIIPTDTAGNLDALTEAEQRIYLLIARAYIAQFFPKQSYDQTTLELQVGAHRFVARSNVTTKAGWRILYTNDVGNEDLESDPDALTLDLRAAARTQLGRCLEGTVARQETKPQPLYTIATLLTDLTRVAKYIRDDNLRQAMLEKDKGKEGEHGGIGTPATRHQILNTLFEHGYILELGKNLVPTMAAEALYQALPDEAKFPDMTAIWHEEQNEIRAGKRSPKEFVDGLMVYITSQLESVKSNGLPIKVEVHPCPLCKAPLRRIPKKEKGSYFWGCTAFEKGCKYACEDKAGKPVPKEPAVVSSLHKCMKCAAGLVARTGPKKKWEKVARRWWGCSNFPTCKQVYDDIAGKPDYSKARDSAESS